MQAYSKGFARAYNRRWSGFARQVAPLLLDFYAATPIGRGNMTVLDLCCGAGHLAVHFLEKGYRVVGLDLSDHMLHYAREHTRRYIETGQATFIQGDARNFTFDCCARIQDLKTPLDEPENEGRVFIVASK